MANTIRLRRGSGVPTPGSFVEAEPAWDSTNGVLYIKNAAGQMVQMTGAVPVSGVSLGIILANQYGAAMP